ncbi:hypothetical protein D3C78_1216330 [compost metagenome]
MSIKGNHDMTEQNTQLVLERNDWIVSLIRAAKGLPLDVEIETLPDHVRQGVELIQQLFARSVSSEWRMMSGDWRDELVSLHGQDGHIASGLTVAQARALIDAHGGIKHALTMGIALDESLKAGTLIYKPTPDTCAVKA